MNEDDSGSGAVLPGNGDHVNACAPKGGKAAGSASRAVRILLFSTLYPSTARPGHGVFVETRLRQLVSTGAVDARVVAPVPWFPSTNPRFGNYARISRTPLHEVRAGIDVAHPRYALPPKIGMSVAPFMLALGAISTVRRLQRQGFDFDLIDAHYFYPDGVAAALLAQWMKKPLVVTARGSDLNLIANYWLPRTMMRWTARRAAANVAVSAALGRVLASWGIDAEAIHVLRNGVDLAQFCPVPVEVARQQLGMGTLDGRLLLSVGNLVALKRHHVAIDALAKLLPHDSGLRLAIVGEGPLRADLQSLARARGLADRVTFHGARPQAELPLWYSAADLLVLASEREGLPNVVLEAMACGTPVVASNVGGIPEILTSSELGALVDPATVEGFADSIRAVLSRQPDRRRIRAYAETLGWQSTTRALVDLFRRIARSSSRAELS